MNEKIVTIAAALKNQGYATGQFGKNHLGDLNHMLPTNHGFDEFFGNLYHLNAEEEPEMYDYYPEKDFPELPQEHRAARRHPFVGDRQGRPDRRAALGQGRQAEDRGHRAADQEAHGDLRRRVRRRGQGLHQAPEEGRQAVLRVAQHHPHALLHAHQEGEPGTGRALAVAVPRHDDRPRQERRPDARLARRARHRRRHLRHVLDRQRAAPQLVARRRHDAVPQREEHQLGRRVPRADAGALARQDQGRLASPTRSSSTTTGCRPSWRWPASPTSSRSSRRATRRSAAPTRTTSTASTCCPT